MSRQRDLCRNCKNELVLLCSTIPRFVPIMFDFLWLSPKGHFLSTLNTICGMMKTNVRLYEENEQKKYEKTVIYIYSLIEFEQNENL